MKNPADTSLGGGRGEFPATTWGMVSRMRQPSRDGLEALCRRYWRPVYRYARVAWSKSNEDAKDLAQAFFAWLIEGAALSRYEPSRGGFRPYLKTILRRFVAHQEEALGRLKRGGASAVVSIDDDAPLAELVADAKSEDPERIFDRAWVTTVVGGAVERVRGRMRTAGRELPVAVFEAVDLAGDPKPTYDEVARRLGVKPGDVRNHLFAFREELRREIRSELAETTSSEEELEEEWNALFGA